MNKLILLPLLLLVSLFTKINAQPIVVVNKDGFFVDKQEIEYPISSAKLTSVLGNQYRTFDGINTIYTYDELGLRLYRAPDSYIINSFYIDFANGSYRFSPQQTFNGTLLINGYKVDRAFKKDSMVNIPNLFFNKYGSIENGYSAVTYNDVSIFFTFDKDGNMISIALSYSDMRGDFETRAQKSDAHATLINIDFKYEKGVMNSHGRKTGVWEYYDNPGELSLKYDHDADTIIYLENKDDEFVIKDGPDWKRMKLKIYPRVIGSESAFTKSLGKLIGYPPEARGQQITGTVYVSFVIDKNSKLRDIKIESDIGGNCGEAVADALKRLKFSWTHAVRNNISYDSKFIIPVNFSFGSDNTDNSTSTDDQPTLPDAYKLPALYMVSWGVPHPIKN